MSDKAVTRSAISRPITLLVGLAATFLVISGLRDTANLVGPTFLALVLTIAVHPLHSWAKRHRLPGWVGTVGGLIAIYLFLLTLTVSFGIAIARFAMLLPTYQVQMSRLLDRALAWLSDLGLTQRQLEKMAGTLDINKLATVAGSVAGGLLGVLTSLGFIAALLLFMVSDAAGFAHKLSAVPAERRPLVRALSTFASGTRRYLLVSTVFGLAVGVVNVLALLVIGVPAAVLWGLLSFITNYIPNVGFVLGLIPPAILGLLQGGPKMMIAVIVAYSAANVLIQSVIQPKVVGNVIDMSATLTMLSLVFWAATLGAIGALMAVPLSLLVKALLVDADPGSAWLQPLLSAQKRSAR
ncbi:AI-2E family transporter [Actinopolymorpha rutila]|uniref:Putative PurR-regulated permease PerM n=1 Tax=Actinopolymorpha rutila TaxID=446787 RepID=A0A852ZM08_9ACTN|nr:AI-2E family transporter [Actinopolymorpha rutila]NYH93293.1 putative PurR-regulated permease PerM [Actinopolymorpha rutila]